MIPPSPLKKEDLFQITNINHQLDNIHFDHSLKAPIFTIRSKNKLLVFILYIIVILTACFLQCNILSSYESNERVKSFYGSSPFNQYNLIQEIEHTSKFLISSLYSSYLNKNNLTYDLSYIPITGIRILIKRRCSNNSDITCENTQPYIKSNNTYFYDNDAYGYPVFLKKFTKNSTLNNSLSFIDYLINEKMFDNDTIVVSMDVSFFNPSTYMITYSELDYQISQLGFVSKSFYSFSFRYNYYENQVDYFRAFLECLFFFFYVFYIIGDSIMIFYLIKHSKIIMENEKSKAGILKENESHDDNQSNKKKHLCCSILIQVFRGFGIYFSRLENLLSFFCNIVGFFIILLWLRFITSNNIINAFSNSSDDNDLNQKIRDHGDLQGNGYYYLLGSFLFINMNRLIMDLCKYSEIGNFYFMLIVSVLKKVLLFLLFLFVFFASFAVFLKNTFGLNVISLSDGYFAGLYLFKILLSDDSQIEAMWRADPLITTFFYIIYFLFIVFILMNMFLVITKNEFLAISEVFQQNQKKTPKTKKDPFKYKLCYVSRLKNLFKSTKLLFLYFFKRNLYELKKKEREVIQDNVNQESKIYAELDFNCEFKSFLQESNKSSQHALTDFEKLSVKKDQIRKFVIFIWKTLFITIAFILFSTLIVYYFDSSTNFNIINNTNMKLTFTSSPDQTPPVYQYSNLLEINTRDQCIYFLENIFPNYFVPFIYLENSNSTIDSKNINYAIVDNVYLINNLIRLTIRKRKYEPIASELSNIFPYKISPTFSRNSEENSYENKNSFTVKSLNRVVEYIPDESFLGLGGYVLYEKPSNKTFSNLISALHDEGFLDMSLNSLVVDFVVANFNDKGMFLKCNIYFEIDDSGKVQTHVYVMSFYRNAIEEVYDYFVLSILILITILYILFGIKTFSDIISRKHNYNIWYTLYIRNRLPKVLLYHRENQKAEFLRKMNFVFNFKVLINVAFLIFGGGFLITVGVYELQVFLFESNATIFNQSVKNFLYSQIFFSPSSDDYVLSHYGLEMNKISTLMTTNGFVIFFASCAVFVLAGKIIFYYSKNESFRLIMSTLKKAFLDFIVLLILFLLLLMTYVVCTYFAFGMKYEEFSSFDAAYYNLLVPMVYFENLGADFDQNDKILLVMLLLPYFIMFKLIWLNCIISIMFNNFQNFDKLEKKKDNEDKTQIRFKDFVYVTLDILRIMKKRTINNANLRKNHDIILQTLQKVNSHLPFVAMKNSIRNAERLKNVNVWADVCSEEIKYEYDSRKFLKDKCDEVIKNVLSSADEFGEDPYYVQLNQINFKRVPIEFELRKVFWDYFRIAHLYFHRYDYHLQKKINEIMNNRKMEELKNELSELQVEKAEVKPKKETKDQTNEVFNRKEMVLKLEENIKTLKHLRQEENHLRNIIYKTEN